MPKRTDLKKIMVIVLARSSSAKRANSTIPGSQGIKALKEEGYEVVLVNSNPRPS